MNKNNLLEDLSIEIYNKILCLNCSYYLNYLKKYLNDVLEQIPKNTNLFRLVYEILNRDLINVEANMIRDVRDFCLDKLNVIIEDGIIEYNNDKNLVIMKIRETIDLKKVDLQIKSSID